TDKVDTEIPSPVAGTLQEIVVQEDETVAVGATLARIGSGAPAPAEAPAPAPVAEEKPAEQPAPAAEEKPAAPAPAAEKPAEQAAPAAEKPAEQAPAAASNDEVTYVTPLVRRLAQQQGVDLATVKGSGVGGRIRKEDVLKAAEAARRCAEPRRRCRVCARSSPSAPWRRCRPPRS
ncbi:MAG: pyruvate/2-oxoglutarate dehydrogenase complex, dihydrolipoamide acyltransferase component, partial [Microbacterium sp.]|nr:pyruvate/2-oxoglutarate dehydrogenase complex, dihydrolipoamide acyltransferase component [Microbacterium sp.]